MDRGQKERGREADDDGRRRGTGKMGLGIVGRVCGETLRDLGGKHTVRGVIGPSCSRQKSY